MGKNWVTATDACVDAKVYKVQRMNLPKGVRKKLIVKAIKQGNPR